MRVTMRIKNKILLFLKLIINKILNESYINLQPTSKIGGNWIIINSNLEGLLNTGSNVSCVNSILKGNITVGDDTKIADVSIKGTVQIGSGCQIDEVSLSGKITIGNQTTINGPNTDIVSQVNEVVIGNFCSIARNVTFQEFNHDFSKMTSYFVNRNLKKIGMNTDIVSKGSITVGHDVWIGTQCVILSGSNIGTGAVIAANSVVTGNIPPYAIAAGSPAKVIKYRFNNITIKFLLESEWWNKSKDEVIKFYDNFKPLE
jgi:acetyltransferase-like isoleucine patch superfamily enzyme